MPKTNLLFIITKLELGGAQKQLLSIIAHIDRGRFNIFLFTARNGLLLDDFISIKDIAVKRSKFLDRPINPLKDFFALIEICLFIKKEKITIVHTHSSKAGVLGRLAAKMAGVKVIIHTVHGWSFNNYQNVIKRKFFIWLERFIARFTDSIVVVSYHDKQKGLLNRIGREDRYKLIHYGIEYSKFNVENNIIRKELGINQNDLLVCMIACFKPQKAPQDFIKAASKVIEIFPNAKFLFVGDGILRRQLEIMIEKYNLQTSVILASWRRDIEKILSATDIFVLTSLWEGFPVSVLEAMASSCPVVVTRTGGVEEIVIEGKNGFLAWPRDIDKVVESLSNLLKDGSLRKKIGRNARDFLNSDFCLDTTIKSNQDLYENLLMTKSIRYA